MFKQEINVFIVIHQNPDISVIIPTFNRSPSLRRALDSVLAQTIHPKEIIVIDDGSTDDTKQILKNYPNLKIIEQTNQGVSSARNRGIEQSTGEWIAFLDSDDEWLPQKLEKQWKDVCANEYLICHTNEIWIRNGKRVNQMKKHRKFGGWIYKKCLPLCVISPSSVMIHKSIFDDVGLFDEDLEVCEDYDLWLRICAKYPVQFIDELLMVKYGGHEDQLSRKHWGMDRFRVEAMEKILKSDCLNEDDRNATLKIFNQKCEIIINGMKKRGKVEEVKEWDDKLCSMKSVE